MIQCGISLRDLTTGLEKLGFSEKKCREKKFTELGMQWRTVASTIFLIN